MANNVFNYNSERLNGYDLINLNEVVASKMAKRIVGKGYVFSTQNKDLKKAFKQLEEWTDIYEFLYESEKILSAYGYLIPTIDKSKGKKIFLNIGQVYGKSQVSRINYTEELAVVWMRDGIDNTGRYLRTVYTRDTIERAYFTTLDETSVLGESAEILKANQLPIKETHNLGVVPVGFLKNLPKKNMFGGQTGEWYPDSTPVKNIQKFVDFLFCVLGKEAEFNRTRVFADITTTEMNTMLQSISSSLGTNDEDTYAIRLKKLIGDFIVSANIRPIEGGSGKAIEILQGNPQFEQYQTMIQACMDWYIWGCGLSPKDDNTSSKTTTEVMYSSAEEDLTVNSKRVYRQKQWKKFFDKVILVMGFDESNFEEYTFELKDNTAKDDMNTLEKEVQLIQWGLSSPIFALTKIKGMSREEAETYLSKVKEDNLRYGSMDISKIEDKETETNEES